MRTEIDRACIEDTTLTHQTVCASLAALPCYGFERAIVEALAGLQDPVFGTLHTEQLQLCPQNSGVLSEELAERLVAQYPSCSLRLHANVRVEQKMVMSNASTLAEHFTWFKQAARVCQVLGAQAYTLHAGTAQESSLDTMFDNLHRLEDLFQCPVGVEGMYPGARAKYHIATWPQYAALLTSGCYYALDLSHLNILAHYTGKQNTQLIAELLQNERCIEVHVSHNDGHSDQHQPMPQEPSDLPWWYSLLALAHPGAVIFSEGNQRAQDRN